MRGRSGGAAGGPFGRAQGGLRGAGGTGTQASETPHATTHRAQRLHGALHLDAEHGVAAGKQALRVASVLEQEVRAGKEAP